MRWVCVDRKTGTIKEKWVNKMENKSITPVKFMDLSRRDGIKRCTEWLKEFNGGKQIKIKNINECPMALWVAYNGKKCNKELVANTARCSICGLPMCPVCGNHAVEQLSRVTGYLQSVSGWNEAKKQEFSDRTRYDL